MTETDVQMMKQLGKTVEQLAGKTIAMQILQGSEQITKSTKKETVALWVRDVMDRLDRSVDESTRIGIMETCGENCAMVNKRVIDSAVARRKKFRDLDSFLEAEQRTPMKGTRLCRKGNVLFQSYTPLAFTPPMRCYCSLLRGLPKESTVSRTYCHCSKAFVQRLWEQVLGQRVTVELLQSVAAGDSECKFAVHF